jgi:CBS domain-containing protein
MSTPAHTVSAAGSPLAALQAMRRHGVRRLPVTGEFGELVGIVALDDLLRSFAGELALFAQTIGRERAIEERVKV